MEWKKLSYKNMKEWEIHLPNTNLGTEKVRFRSHSPSAKPKELLDFLKDVYGVRYLDSAYRPINYSVHKGKSIIKVEVTNLFNRNVAILTEDLPWDFVVECRKKDFDTKGSEEINLLQQVVLAITKAPSWDCPGALQNKLIEYQQLLCIAGFLRNPTKKLDRKTYQAHLKFLKVGLNLKLGLSTYADIHSGDPERSYIIVWIQEALGLPVTYTYDLMTWHAVKEAKRKAGNITILPPASSNSEQLIEFFIPWESLGVEDEKTLELIKTYCKERAYGFSLPTGDSAGASVILAAEHYRKGFEKKIKESYLKELAEFNKAVERENLKREEKERRAQALFKKVLDNPILFADEAILGETATSIIYALRPESVEGLIWEYVFAVGTAALSVAITAFLAARRARRARKALKAWKMATARAKRKTGIIARSGKFLEKMNKVQRIAKGEKIIFSSKTKRGFDLVSYTGRGRKAKLFLDECKNWGKKFIRGKTYGKKKIPISRLKTLVKKSEYNLSVRKAKNSLKKLLSCGQIDKETYGALFHQLESKTFTIRVVPGPDAKVTNTVMSKLSEHFKKAKVILDKSFME